MRHASDLEAGVSRSPVVIMTDWLSEVSMMMQKYRFILFMPFLLLGGCSSGEDKTTPDQSSKGQILKDQTQALEKAKEVDRVIQSGVDKRRQAIEEQSK